MGNVNSAKKKISKREIKEYKRRVSRCSESILLVDDKANFIRANRAAIKMFKAKSKKDVLSRGPAGLAGPYQPAFKMPTKQATDLILRNAFESPDGFYDFDFLHIDLDGKEFWCHVWLTPINWDGKMVLQGYTRPVSGPGVTKAFDLGEEASFFVKPIAEKMLQAKSKTETDSQTDSFIGDDFKSTTEFSDTEYSSKISGHSPKNSENPTKESERSLRESQKSKREERSNRDQENFPKESKKKNAKSKKAQRDTTTNFSNIILFEADENTVQIQNRIDKIKTVVRSHDNPVLEKTVVQELNEIKKIFNESTQILQKHISQLADKLQKERNQNQEKYSQLELHLQKSLSKTQEAQNGYETLFNKMKVIEELFDDKLAQILHPQFEKQN
ncbi:protein kinase pkn/prk1 effector [Anaeramoeba ignava]|uniref:Protein kinase pkn/prk1 effector n=1 Tax=Anaeramoeba ignava TaxID=1746090 RepID=A0A9Q0LPK3_ANAIG|nr:protein kinase pkn/prk1 effector [Anaeramoeba ignava]